MDILLRHLWDLKIQAMRIGRYPENYVGPFWFDCRDQLRKKDGMRPFRCIEYNRMVRLINRIECEMQKKRLLREAYDKCTCR